MSTKIIQEFLHNRSIFTFSSGHNSEGMLVARYNITLATIEYYFIPVSSITEYHNASCNRDLSAHKRLGEMIDINSIRNIKPAN